MGKDAKSYRYVAVAVSDQYSETNYVKMVDYLFLERFDVPPVQIAILRKVAERPSGFRVSIWWVAGGARTQRHVHRMLREQRRGACAVSRPRPR